MRFEKNVIREDIIREFSGINVEFSESDEALEAVFRSETGSVLTLRFDDRFSLRFDRWHGEYILTDDEYERLLWDVRDIVHGNAYAVSVMVGNTLFISYLTRGEMNSADDFIDDDPIECSGLRKTGAVIECVYYDKNRNKKFLLERETKNENKIF